MSAETSTWLNTQTLIGFTEKRGNAWHYRAEDQGDESNHYVGPVPVEDVRRRLFNWKPLVGTVESTVITPEGVSKLTDETSQSLWHPVTGHRFGTFKLGYKIHDYDEWLIAQAANLLDDSELSIGSAGLLRQGGLAWVQVEVPETIDTPEGVSFRPFLTSATSLDGSLSSTYNTGVQLVVCDNTLSAALGDESAKQVKIKHSRNSIGRLTEVREALELVHRVADDYSAQVHVLCATEVSDKAWASFLDAHVELPKEAGRSRTLAEGKREALQLLWNNDNRVSPWKGTAFGVIQAVNTFTHHVATTRGASKAERNAERAVLGKVDQLDQGTLDTLQKVLAAV